MAYQGVDHAPLLPASLEDRLRGLLCRVSGLAILLALAAASVSLLSWSVGDPSLTRATNVATRNLLGPLGAILSDLLLQTLGLAGVFALLPPLFWALQLAGKEPVRAWRRKLALTPVAILLLAGAFSSLPIPAAWPLHHGLGGLMGDAGLGLLTGLLGSFNPDRAAAAAGLFLFAGGLMVMLASLGLSQADLKRICQQRPRRGFGLLSSLGGRLADTIRKRHEPMLVMAPTSYRASALREERVPPRIGEVAGRGGVQLSDDAVESGRGVIFDHSTDRGSRAIAERFAPDVGGRVEPRFESPPPAEDDAFEPQAPVRYDGAYRRPPLSMLKKQPVSRAGTEAQQLALRNQARQLADVLRDFGVNGEVRQVHPGPVINLFEFEPARGVKTARIAALADDIARSLGAPAVRVAVVPGRNAVGIELPSPRREKVFLRDLLEAEAFRAPDLALPLALGSGISGAPVFADLARMPHLLVAGTTGSGKSVAVNAMILSLLYRHTPEQLRLVMIDPKMLELSVYNGIPHLLCPVVTDPEQAVSALNWAVREMEQRYQRMARLGVRNIDVFNNRVRNAQKRGEISGRPAGADLAPMPHIVIVVDEFADLMMVAGKEIEAAVKRLAQMARAAGIHLVMATQRPSVDVVTGTIKANFPTRISFKVASKFDSRTILNEQGAEHLLGQGDMLFAGGGSRVVRVHAPFVSDEEVEGVATFLRGQSQPRYVGGITDPALGNPGLAAGSLHDAGDELYTRAVDLVQREGKASASYLRHRLSIKYDLAVQLLARMEREGIIEKADGAVRPERTQRAVAASARTRQ
jgi:DNA segregation ATPase FtsK/SpoIIIE, S-DNA-T family